MDVTRASDGATLAFEATGKGAGLVLVHGITESHDSWDPLIGELARDFLVVAVDLRGHGNSERHPPYDALTMAADLHAVIEAASMANPLVVGHSLGGAVASIYAGMFAVRGVIDVDQPLALAGFKELLTQLEPSLRGDEASFHVVMGQLFEALDGALPAEERARIAKSAHPEQGVVLGIWDTVLGNDVDALDHLAHDIAHAITVPFLAIHGSDPGEAYRTWLSAELPSSTLEIWDGDGHYPHLVEPERFLHRLKDFVSSL